MPAPRQNRSVQFWPCGRPAALQAPCARALGQKRGRGRGAVKQPLRLRGSWGTCQRAALNAVFVTWRLHGHGMALHRVALHGHGLACARKLKQRVTGLQPSNPMRWLKFAAAVACSAPRRPCSRPPIGHWQHVQHKPPAPAGRARRAALRVAAALAPPGRRGAGLAAAQVTGPGCQARPKRGSRIVT